MNLESSTAALRTMIESDDRYFELGATRHPGLAGHFSVMTGLESLPSGSLFHRVSPDTISPSFEPWIDRMETLARDLGLAHVRFYLPIRQPDWEHQLQNRGYKISIEEILVMKITGAPPASDIELVPVATEKDWIIREDLFSGLGSDGHPLIPQAWNTMERRKAANGGMQFLMATKAGVPVGTVGYLHVDDLFRIKNLYVHPGYRNQGVAAGIVREMIRMSYDRKARLCGLMAINPGPALALYQRLGFQSVGQHYEWMKKGCPT